MDKGQLEEIKVETEKLLADLEIKGEASVEYDSDNQVVNLQVESPEAAFLIGFHGETLQALQLILSFLVHRLLGDWVKVSVNVGDYRQRREEQLKRLALSLAQKVKFSGEAQIIPNLSPSERRVVHLALADHPEVTSESEGEGRNRVLTIKPKV